MKINFFFQSLNVDDWRLNWKNWTLTIFKWRINENLNCIFLILHPIIDLIRACFETQSPTSNEIWEINHLHLVKLWKGKRKKEEEEEERYSSCSGKTVFFMDDHQWSKIYNSKTIFEPSSLQQSIWEEKKREKEIERDRRSPLSRCRRSYSSLKNRWLMDR